jgi:hypothetical protein
MVLLSVTLVLALVVGIFSFGFLGPSADKVTLTTGRLIGGVTTDNATVSSTASLLFELNDPGRTTNITAVQLNGNSLGQAIVEWSVTSNPQSGNSFFVSGHNSLQGGKVSIFTLYPVESPSVSITSGGTYGYVIDFANGQSISGYFVAQ